MWKALLYKLFGLEPLPCLTCEVLREQLAHSEHERRDLLNRLLDKDKPELPTQQSEEPVPIQPQYTPWRVRQQLLEQEDRKRAALLHDKKKEIADLEKELGIIPSVTRGPSGGIKSEMPNINATLTDVVGPGEEDASEKREAV